MRNPAWLLLIANIPSIIIIIGAFYMLTHGFGIGSFMLTIFIAALLVKDISIDEK